MWRLRGVKKKKEFKSWIYGFLNMGFIFLYKSIMLVFFVGSECLGKKLGNVFLVFIYYFYWYLYR